MKMIKEVFTLAIVFTIFGCSSRESDGNGRGYEVNEIEKIEDCSLYALVFPPGNDILFKLNTAGSCSELTKDDVLKGLEVQLSESINSIQDELTGHFGLIEVGAALTPSWEEIMQVLNNFTNEEVHMCLEVSEGRVLVAFSFGSIEESEYGFCHGSIH